MIPNQEPPAGDVLAKKLWPHVRASATVIGCSRPTHYEPFDGRIDRSPYFFTPEVELPKHTQEVISPNPHLQPGFIRLKTVATRLVPGGGILAFFDPVLDVAPFRIFGQLYQIVKRMYTVIPTILLHSSAFIPL
jgi:hypothetical protein